MNAPKKESRYLCFLIFAFELKVKRQKSIKNAQHKEFSRSQELSGHFMCLLFFNVERLAKL
ncbi:hypothetical protein D1BOALGB6SA_4368 [Olavius sp. associated proteobacterium Delta 1]|nr:hypothetical protein D1BOALGB6SA_4368 [Olavius sp. associated proteobacterium Delta 1]